MSVTLHKGSSVGPSTVAAGYEWNSHVRDALLYGHACGYDRDLLQGRSMLEAISDMYQQLVLAEFIATTLRDCNAARATALSMTDRLLDAAAANETNDLRIGVIDRFRIYVTPSYRRFLGPNFWERGKHSRWRGFE